MPSRHNGHTYRVGEGCSLIEMILLGRVTACSQEYQQMEPGYPGWQGLRSDDGLYRVPDSLSQSFEDLTHALAGVYRLEIVLVS